MFVCVVSLFQFLYIKCLRVLSRYHFFIFLLFPFGRLSFETQFKIIFSRRLKQPWINIVVVVVVVVLVANSSRCLCRCSCRCFVCCFVVAVVVWSSLCCCRVIVLFTIVVKTTTKQFIINVLVSRFSFRSLAHNNIKDVFAWEVFNNKTHFFYLLYC